MEPPVKRSLIRKLPTTFASSGAGISTDRTLFDTTIATLTCVLRTPSSTRDSVVFLEIRCGTCPRPRWVHKYSGSMSTLTSGTFHANVCATVRVAMWSTCRHRSNYLGRLRLNPQCNTRTREAEHRIQGVASCHRRSWSSYGVELFPLVVPILHLISESVSPCFELLSSCVK